MFGFLAHRFAPRFRFLDPGDLRDGDLRLIQPTLADADDFLRSAKHPDSAGSEDGDVTPTRFAGVPAGQPQGPGAAQPADRAVGGVPLLDAARRGLADPDRRGR